MMNIKKCNVCKKEYYNSLGYCPHCGEPNIEQGTTNRYGYDQSKKLEHLHEIEITLEHLEEELDAFLCKKR